MESVIKVKIEIKIYPQGFPDKNFIKSALKKQFPEFISNQLCE